MNVLYFTIFMLVLSVAALLITCFYFIALSVVLRKQRDAVLNELCKHRYIDQELTKLVNICKFSNDINEINEQAKKLDGIK